MTNLVSCSVAALIAFAVSSGSAVGQQVETPEGPVEFVGLHRWTIEMIQDSMRVHAPGKPLGHCAGVLRDLGFPSAQALYMTSPDRPPSTLVILVEPQDSALVRYRVPRTRARGPMKAWGPAYRILRDHVMAFQAAAQGFGIHAVGDTIRERLILGLHPKDSSQVRGLWDFLEKSRSPETAASAERILLEDANVENRRVAAAILGAQRGRVRTWYALVQGLRDSSELVAAAAEMGLTSLSAGPQSRIDWQPALADIRAVLDGTNVLALRTALIVLTKTSIDRKLAPNLLRPNGGLVFDLLSSHSTSH